MHVEDFGAKSADSLQKSGRFRRKTGRFRQLLRPLLAAKKEEGSRE
jgi:hypothetical protein